MRLVSCGRERWAGVPVSNSVVVDELSVDGEKKRSADGKRNTLRKGTRVALRDAVEFRGFRGFPAFHTK